MNGLNGDFDMKDIFVCNRLEVWHFAPNNGVTHILSLLDHGVKPPLPHDFNHSNWKLVHFEDVFAPLYDRAPKIEHVRDCLDWASKLPEDAVLLVHCEAGISRSTAMAMAILTQKMGKENFKEAMEIIVKKRPIACPNPLIATYADDIFDLGGKYLAASEEIVSPNLVEHLKAKFDIKTKK
jgi:predicted protein tyrosine phosphatase